MNYASKRWLLVPLFVGITQTGFAQESVKSLVVSLNNPINEKREMVFALSGTPKYWRQGENLVVESSSLKGEFALSNVSQINFAFATPTSGLKLIQDESISLFPNPATEMILIKGINQSQSVTLTDLNGRSLPVSKETNGETMTIHVSQLSPSTYVLNIDGQTFKFVKR